MTDQVDRATGHKRSFSSPPSFEQYLEHVRTAFAVTRGHRHTLVYANAAFCALVGKDCATFLGRSVEELSITPDTGRLTGLLDRAFRTGEELRDRDLRPTDASVLLLSCSIWPALNASGITEHLLIELRIATEGELTLAVQREVAEGLLLSALRERDSADVAVAARRSAEFLAAESRRLADSLHEDATLAAMAGMSLPYVGDWCIVDILDDDAVMRRLTIVHPDPAKQAILENLHGRWKPEPDDQFGLPATLRNAERSVLIDNVDEAVGTAARDPEIYAALRALNIGSLLTVPLVIREKLIGAITFVSGQHDRHFTPEDTQLAEDLANRSAAALDRARAYGEALSLKLRADTASAAKSTFLGMMSHELRTPLNAIGGYVQLLDMGIHGPVTEAQHVDLARIRVSTQYLMGLITDLLDFTSIGAGTVTYTLGDVAVNDVVAASVALVEPLIAQRQLLHDVIPCDPPIILRADREKAIQILVNLLSNAVKFTPAQGRLVLDCVAADKTVQLRLSDTGAGIPSDMLDAIFDPFVQIKSSSLAFEGGIGLGLAISRSLARGMNGDLTVESTLGEGSRFTLTLPRA